MNDQAILVALTGAGVKLKRPKSCDGCAALMMVRGEVPRCVLGLRLRGVHEMDSMGVPANLTPVDQCPKPRAITKMVEYQGIINGR